MIKSAYDINCDKKINQNPKQIYWLTKEIPEQRELKTPETSINSINAFGLYKKETVYFINRED